MNNRAYPHPYDFDGHPSFIDLAKLSKASYTEMKAQEWFIFMPNWRSIWGEWTKYSDQIQEFRAACYLKTGDDGKIVHVVFAFGGTDPLKIFDLISDAYIMNKSVPPMLNLATKWAQWMLKEITRAFGDDLFKTAHGTMTGHSLGAYLAQMVFLTTHGLGKSFEDRPFVNYVGFESPNVYDSLVALYGSKHAAMVWTNNFHAFCKTINSAPNAINSCQEPFGKMFYVKPKWQVGFNDFYLPYPIPKSPIENLYYYLYDWTLYVHGIDQIIEALKVMEPMPDTNHRRWSGFFGGYGEFTNYNFCPFQNEFWSIYAENLWRQNKVNHARYNDNFMAFHNELQGYLNAAMGYCQNQEKYGTNKMLLFSAKNDEIRIRSTPDKPREESSFSCTIS